MIEALEEYLSQHRALHLEQLKQFLRIPSISMLAEYRNDVRRCATWVVRHLQSCGFEHVELLETPGHPIVYADWLHAPGCPTVLVYGHYDVQPVEPVELWEHDPFEPTIHDGRLYARGASDDKSQVFLHIKSFEALFATKGNPGINVKFCIEGEEETGSEHVTHLLRQQPARFNADVVVISDTAMLGPEQPAVCYGLRGIVACQIDVKGASTDLHSGGMYGGAVQNPIHALVEVLRSMRGGDGKITVDGFYEHVRPLSTQEQEAFRHLPYSDEDMKQRLQVPDLFGEQGYTTLERAWARPTLEVNGIFGGYQGEGCKTVIPCEAHAKITCRLVPDQEPGEIIACLERHIRSHIPPGVTISFQNLGDSTYPYITPLDNPFIQQAALAYEKAYGVPASFIRAGGSIGIVEAFSRVLQIPIVLMGFALPTSNAHAPNEHFLLENVDKGIRTLCYYWNELAGIHSSSQIESDQNS
jgi:acetylornithine deacetylase/succinyl-diaminopimelate desuccinylase-like protein